MKNYHDQRGPKHRYFVHVNNLMAVFSANNSENPSKKKIKKIKKEIMKLHATHKHVTRKKNHNKTFDDGRKHRLFR